MPFSDFGTDTNGHVILNNLLLIFKMYIYNVRTTGYLNIYIYIYIYLLYIYIFIYINDLHSIQITTDKHNHQIPWYSRKPGTKKLYIWNKVK